ncbi:MAG: hypothetical protein SH817_07775 [Leptospira sp.]|nr:hypothetical protein [Leptospira sp.]
MKVSLSILLFIFAFSCLIQCKAKESSYQEDYNNIILLQLATAPNNPTPVCVNLLKKQTECLTARATSLGIITPLSSDETYSNQCTTLLQSNQFNTMSPISQTCVLTCQETDWKTKVSSGECTTSTPSSLIASSSSNITVRNCIRSCFQTTNGVVSDSDISKLLIFNFIQNGD